jgi:hypothetical protein
MYGPFIPDGPPTKGARMDIHNLANQAKPLTGPRAESSGTA